MLELNCLCWDRLILLQMVPLGHTQLLTKGRRAVCTAAPGLGRCVPGPVQPRHGMSEGGSSRSRRPGNELGTTSRQPGVPQEGPSVNGFNSCSNTRPLTRCPRWTDTPVTLLRAKSCLHCDLQLRDRKLAFVESVGFMIMTLSVIIAGFLMSVTVRNASKSKDKDKGQNLKPLWKAELQ